MHVTLLKRARSKDQDSARAQREVPESEVTKLRKQLEDEQSKRLLNDVRMEKLEKKLENTRKLLTQILKNKE